MRLQRYGATELERFLSALDGALSERASMVVIGGSALALGYGVSAITSDVDTYQSERDAILLAALLARRTTGLEIPVADSTIAQLPGGFDQRLIRVLPELERLEIWVPTHTTSPRASCSAATSTTASSSWSCTSGSGSIARCS